MKTKLLETVKKYSMFSQGENVVVGLSGGADSMCLISLLQDVKDDLKIGLSADVSPISGTEKQCRDFAEFIKSEYEQNPEKVWKTDVFGKQLCSLVSDEILAKITSMRPETKNKMRKTVTRIVNEGRGGVICILL